MLRNLFCLLIIIFLIGSMIIAAPLYNIPLRLVQPDGTVLNVYQSGDEFYNWVHDKPYTDTYNWRNARENYTILKNKKTGYYVYAVIEHGVLVASDYVVGKVDPASVGIEKGLNVFPDLTEKVRLAKANYNISLPNPVVDARYNLVMFIRFKNESEFSADSLNIINNTFNNASGPSVKHYYNETSNGLLNMSGTIYPLDSKIVSYEDIYDRKYFKVYDAANNPTGYKPTEKGAREDALIRRALAFISSRMPTGALLDGNGDGQIDNVIFIVHGNSEGWNDLLWSHMSSLLGNTITIADKIVNRYNFIMQNHFGWSVLVHELGHTLGMPDLYRYNNNDIVPIGIWDLMASNVAYMNNYMKWRYLRWITDIPEITASGTYWLKKSGAISGNVYKIKSPKNPTEYFILEYRYRQGFYESYLPGSGLVVYRVNGGLSGNAYGPPDEVYIYRQGGTTTNNGDIGSAFFNNATTRTQINDNTNPSSFLSNNTPGGLSIKDIGNATGDSISFNVEITGNFVNDYTVQSIPYIWEDISSSGTKINDWVNGNSVYPDSTQDDGYSNSAIPLGFEFTFYGQKFNSIYVGINGLVSFSDKYLNVGNEDQFGAGIFGFFNYRASWPGNKYFPNSIAPAYFDFDLVRNDNYGGGRILYKTVGEKFILSWLNVGSFGQQNDTTNTFQLVLNKNDNSMTVNYQRFGLARTGTGIKVGIQKDITNGLGWLNAGDITDRIPADGSSVRFSLNPLLDISDVRDKIPLAYNLNQNYPNPFNPTTNITYLLPARSKVILKVFDSLGREINTLVNSVEEQGAHIVKFNARQLASGVYVYQIYTYPAGNGQPFTQARKMMVLK